MLVAAAAGGVLTWLGYRHPRALSLAPQLGRSSAGATLRFSF